jgi:hypothetical protein
MTFVEKVAFGVASAAMAALAVVLVAPTAAAPEPQVGPEGRVPAWVEQERAAPTGSRSAAGG